MSRKIKVHFPGYDQSQKTIPIAYSCGLGEWDERFACGLRVEDPALAKTCEILETEGGKLWERVDAAEAEIMVYPHNVYEVNDGVLKASQLAESKGVTCLFFRCHDSPKPMVLPYGEVYQTSAYASEVGSSEHVLPAFVCDYMQGKEDFRYRPKRERPKVGFCGFTGTGLVRFVYRLQMRFEKVKGLMLRSNSLRYLEETEGVDKSFIRRKHFWGGAKSRFKDNRALAQEVRKTYINNLAECDYVLCIRGTGNFSFRFYETLSRGRIPLFVNTDCQLPFSDQINWKEHCVWVEDKDLKNIGELLVAFHENLSDDEFLALQQKNYELWQEWLGPVGYYLKLFGRHLDMSRYED